MMNMAKAGTEKAGAIRYGRVYASSVIQDYQDGKVYTLGNSAVIHHHCGFAFLIGNPTEEELSALYREMMRQDFGRFLLFCDEERIVDHFRDLPGVCIRGRYFFEYPLSDSKPAEVPQGYVLQEIDEELALMLKGRITLSFSWRNFDEFKKSGKGYCLTVNNKPVAWAFSAAVSDDEIDIGVECLEEYRHQGLSAVVVKEMIRYILDAGKKPVWACQDTNEFSGKLAEKCGFIRTGECCVINVM